MVFSAPSIPAKSSYWSPTVLLPASSHINVDPDGPLVIRTLRPRYVRVILINCIEMSEYLAIRNMIWQIKYGLRTRFNNQTLTT